MSRIIWIGNRLSDIETCLNFFDGSINLYGDDHKNHVSFYEYRANNNISNPSFDKFIEKHINDLLMNNDEIKLMFYNPRRAYSYGSLIQQHTVCLNDMFILDLLSDKITCHNLLNDIVDFAPYVTLFEQQISYNNLKRIFPKKYDKFVVQSSKSSGGFGTYLMRQDNDFEIQKLLKSKQQYLVSAYIEGNVSINVHAFIGANDHIILPASKQIITLNQNHLSYRGADYINTTKINHSELRRIVTKIVKRLKFYNYRGIVGFDFIQDLNTNKLYLVELNCRFQGSSFLLNSALLNYNCPSLQELNLLSFGDILIGNLIPKDLEINLGATFYYKNEDAPLTIENAKHIKTDDDGLIHFDKIEPFAYLYKEIYQKVES